MSSTKKYTHTLNFMLLKYQQFYVSEMVTDDTETQSLVFHFSDAIVSIHCVDVCNNKLFTVNFQ